MYTLILIVMSAGGAKQTHTDGFASMDACRAQAQTVTGDTRKASDIDLVFTSPNGHAMAYCRPTK